MSVVLYQITLRSRYTSTASTAITFSELIQEPSRLGEFLILCKSPKAYEYINGMLIVDSDSRVHVRGAGSLDVAEAIRRGYASRAFDGGVYVDEELHKEVNSMFDFS